MNKSTVINGLTCSNEGVSVHQTYPLSSYYCQADAGAKCCCGFCCYGFKYENVLWLICSSKLGCICIFNEDVQSPNSVIFVSTVGIYACYLQCIDDFDSCSRDKIKPVPVPTIILLKMTRNEYLCKLALESEYQYWRKTFFFLIFQADKCTEKLRIDDKTQPLWHY